MPEIKPRYKSGYLHDVAILGASFYTCRFVDCVIFRENTGTDRYWENCVVAGSFSNVTFFECIIEDTSEFDDCRFDNCEDGSL